MTLILCLTVLCLDGRGVLEPSSSSIRRRGGPQERPESRQEQLERELAEARYRLGPVRIAPWASCATRLRAQHLLHRRGRQPDDVTATAGAGFRAYLRNGPKATWTAQVLPEYVWWQRQTQRRQLNGRYSLGFSGFFNRLTLEVRAGARAAAADRHPRGAGAGELPARRRRDADRAGAHRRLLGLRRRLRQPAEQPGGRRCADPDVASLRLLDRDERVERGGCAGARPGSGRSALGAEHSQVDFARRPSTARTPAPRRWPRSASRATASPSRPMPPPAR